jgi:hypothetical protein
MNHKLSNLITLLVIFTLFSCMSEEYCTKDLQAEMNIGFYSLEENDAAVSFSILNVYGYQNDSLINADTTSVSKINLPLSNSSDTSTFIFTWTVVDYSQTDSTGFITDTLNIYYSRELNFVSTACGFMYNYRLNNFNYTNHIIDSIIFANTLVSNFDEEHLQILVDSIPNNKSSF